MEYGFALHKSTFMTPWHYDMVNPNVNVATLRPASPEPIPMSSLAPLWVLAVDKE